MKAGLAAGIAAMEAYRGEANLLFLAVSDEEDRSAGARAAVPLLPAIAAEHGLDIALVINLDAISDQGDGASGRVVALGSIGKQLLTAFVTGKEAHACYPQDGANAAYLGAELLTEFELAPELAETSGSEIAAPPTALHAKDLKSGYNVTTPAQCWLYWNTLQHRRSAADVLDVSLMLARRAMARAARKIGRDIPVMSYAELAARVPQAELARIAREVAALTDLDLPERAKLMTAEVWRASGLSGPAVVMGFGSIPYPAVSLSDAGLEDAIVKAAAAHGLSSLRYFPGISDMSFFGEASGDLSAAAANTPIWGTSFTMPETAGYPCINIGPWGRDYHHWLERLHAPYAFDTLPRVLLSVIEAVDQSPLRTTRLQGEKHGTEAYRTRQPHERCRHPRQQGLSRGLRRRGGGRQVGHRADGQDMLAQIDETLKEAGTDKTKIIKANIWLTDIKTFAEMNAAWDAWVVPGQTPARATVESKLAAPGLDVEIMVEAALD